MIIFGDSTLGFDSYFLSIEYLVGHLKLGENGNKSTNTLNLHGLKTCIYIALISLLFYSPIRAQQDVGVSTLLNPVSGCSVGLASNPINVIVRNYSLSTAFPNSITVNYRINSGPITSELIGAFLGPNASFNFTFFQKANLSACGNYQIKVWTQKIGDPNPLNDTLNYLFVNDCPPIPGTITGPPLLCDNINNDSLTISGGTYAYGYEWHQQIVPGSFNATGVTTNKFYLNNLTDSSTYYVVYDGGFCADVNSSIFGVGISPNIVTGTISPDLTLCEDNIVGSVSVSGFTALIEDWEQSNNSGATWTSLGTTSSTVNISYLADSALFRAKIKSGACGSKYSDTISVAIEPLIIPGNITGATTVCSGFNSISLTLSGHQNHFGYEWYTSTDGINFTPTGFTTSVYPVSNILVTTYYKVVLFGNMCSDDETPVVTVVVDPPVNGGSTSPNLNFCENNVVGNVSVSGYTSTLLYWEQSNDNGLTWFSTGVNTNSHDISYLTSSARFRAAIQSGTCPIGYSNEITVNLEPLIVPGYINGPVNVCGVSNLDTLRIESYSNTGTLQWYYTYDSINFIAANITTPTLITSNLNQTAHFFVILSSIYCPNDTTSAITVNVDPYLNLGTPSADLTLCETNITGSVTINGFSSNILDWEQSNDGGLTWFSTGDNSVSHDISSITANADFRALIESGLCGSGYSDTISVLIEPAIIPGTISAGSTVCASSNADTLVLTGNLNDFGFQWYSSTDNITFTPTGIFNDTLIAINLTQTTYYKVVLYGNGCPNDETNVSTITVDSILNLGVSSANLTLCSNNVSGVVSLTGFATNLMDWEQSNDGGLTWSSTGDNSSNHDISGLTASADFRAFINSGACGSGYSDTISVSIENEIIPGSIIGATPVCSSSNSDTLVLIGNLYDFGFEWYSSTDNITFTPTGITNDTLITINLTQTTYYKVILFGNVCSNEETSVVSIQVDYPLNLGVTSPDLNLCSTNITGNVSLSGFNSVILDWEQSNDGGLTWFSTGDNNSNHDISGLSASADFRAIVDAGACGSGISDTISVVIESSIIPGTINGSTFVCSGPNADTLVLTGNANDFGYQWYSATLNTSYFPTGVTNDTLIISNLTETTYFKVILNGNACSNDETAIFTVQLNPLLNVGVTSADLMLCSSNVSGNVSLSGYTTTLLDWEQSNDGGLTWFSTTDNNNSHNISTLSATAHFRALVESPGCGIGYSDTILVDIQNAIIPGAISGSTLVCSGNNSDTLVLSGNSNDFGYQWYTATLNTSFFPTGVTNDTLILSNITQETYVKVILIGDNCPNDETNILTIQVSPSLNLGNTSSDLNLCSNSITGSVSLSGYSTTFIDWEQSNDGGLTWTSTGNNLPSHDISYLLASAHFRASVSSGSCGTGYSDTIAVTIENAIVPGTISSNNIVCSGNNTDTLVLTGNANEISYEWYSSLDNIVFTPTGITNDTLITNNLTQSQYFKVILQGNICPMDETNTIYIQVDSNLNLGTISPDLLLCSTNIVGSVSLSNYSSTIQDWEQSDDGGLTWNSTGISTSSLDISYLSTSALFRAIVNAGACGSGISDTISVTIENAIIPGTINGSTALCAGNNTDTLIFTGYANQTGYEWYSATLNTSFFPTGVTNDTLIINNLTQTTYFKVILTGNACPNDETVVDTVQVDPLVVTGLPSPNLNLCETNIVGTISLSNFATSITDWEISTNNGITWSSLGSNNNPLDISFLTNSSLFRAVISSGACGTGISDTISVQVDPLGIPASIGFDFDACIGSSDYDSMKVISHTGNLAFWQFSTNGGTSWTPTTVTDSIYYANYLIQNTSYQLVTTHGACPNVASNMVNATVNPLPFVSAGSDTTIIIGTSTQLVGMGGLFGIWTPNYFLSNQNLPSPNCYPNQTTSYAYTVIDANGCTNTDYVQVSVIDDTVDLSFVIYNIVTPNGDGKNDFFTIKGINTLPNHLVKIFNANGNLIFSSKDYKNDWGATKDGKIVPDGTYLYAVEIDNVTMYRGFLTIMKGND
jgi:gliding motility-associated-like protein